VRVGRPVVGVAAGAVVVGSVAAGVGSVVEGAGAAVVVVEVGRTVVVDGATTSAVSLRAALPIDPTPAHTSEVAATAVASQSATAEKRVRTRAVWPLVVLGHVKPALSEG
jgi:acyl dehydratase